MQNWLMVATIVWGLIPFIAMGIAANIKDSGYLFLFFMLPRGWIVIAIWSFIFGFLIHFVS